MTDTPHGDPTHGKDPEESLSADEEIVTESGLVVEDDELELEDAAPSAPAAEVAHAEVDPDPQPESEDDDLEEDPDLDDEEYGEDYGAEEDSADDPAGAQDAVEENAPDESAAGATPVPDQPEPGQTEPAQADPDQQAEAEAEPTGEQEPRGFPDDEPYDELAAVAAHPRPGGEPPSGGPPQPQDDHGRRRRWGRRITLGLVAVVAALYVGGYFLTGTRMPANASIGRVDVSGKSPAEARASVDKALTPLAGRKILLTHGKKEFPVKPRAAGLSLDLDRSIAEAGGERSWKPADIAGLFVGQHDSDPALDVDDAALSSVIKTIGESVDTEVVEPQITFPDGKPKAREPKPGLVISRSDAAAAIRKAYLVSDDPVEVPTVVVEATVDSEELAAEMKSFAEPAVSGPVTITAGDKDVSLPVSAFAPALVVRVKDNRLSPYIDPKKLAGPLTDSTTGIGTKAVDATVRIEDNKPVVVPGKEGIGLQPQEMATKLLPVLSRTGSGRAVSVEAKVVKPAFTTADAKDLGIKEKISEFVTSFPYAEYRNTNQGRAAEILNHTILKPGETFSFNNVVGERTVANGFVTGTVINGGVFREELGGGVSQVATTAYNAGFFGGMDDTEHHPHAFYINRYPVGREATVYFGSLDLRFKNPTKYGVLIHSYVKKSTPGSAGEMHVELWSTKVWDIKATLSERRNGRDPGLQYDDTERCVPQGPIAGFDIDIFRTFYQGGRKVKTETDTANYQAADKVICGKKPKAD